MPTTRTTTRGTSSGKFFNWFHFNNGFHGMHHLEAGLHWSLLPQKHAELIAPHVHPALEQKSLAIYLLRTFVFETRRLRYDGAPLVLPEEGEDEDWIGPAASPRLLFRLQAESLSAVRRCARLVPDGSVTGRNARYGVIAGRRTTPCV